MKYLFTSISVLLCTLLSAQVNDAQIRQSLAEAAPSYGLQPGDIAEYLISSDYTQKSTGSSHVYLVQTVHGHEIFNAIFQLHYPAGDGTPYSNSRFVPDASAKTNASVPQLDAKTAFAQAAKAVSLPAGTQPPHETATGHPDRVLLSDDNLLSRPSRVTLGYEKVGDRLVLAYKLIIEPKGKPDMFNIRVNALTGEVIAVNNRTLSCKPFHMHTAGEKVACAAGETALEAAPEKIGAVASYRAFPLGIESPIYGSRALLSGIESAAASPFGWHDDDGITGADYTLTAGNNVYVYEDQQDLNMPGYSPDGGPSLSFDYPLNLNLAPEQNMDAALTNLFVWNNFMHDVTYHYGFDEASANFQANNYGNPGWGDDFVHAQGFDGSGTNNANFGTPEDGMSPLMQMYLWYQTEGNLLHITAPAGISGSYACGGATFGATPPLTPLTGNLVLMKGNGPNVTEGCGFLTNAPALNGKIAVADRGNCTFVEKAQNAQDAGAIALVVINNQPGAAPTMGGDDFGTVTIPCISISQANGALIKAQLQNNVTVSGSIGGPTQNFVFDSDFDNGVICHEYGHGVSNRLTGGGSNVDCLFNDEQAGEGWSDFFALVMTDVPGSSADQVRGMANYVNGDPTSGTGIRPYPYTHNMSVNPFTYADIAGVSIPHGVGSVWCTALWDLYWDMVAVYGHTYDLYATAGGNNKTIRLVMEGLRLQPCNPGFTDSRDAILQADQMLYGGANQCLIWRAFARRGLGYSANQGSSFTTGDETEAFDLPPGCSLTDVSFSASATNVCASQSVTFQSQVVPAATSYQWSFPGGTPATSAQASPTVTYPTPGTYSVSLTATNANGTQTHTQAGYITVSAPIVFSVSSTPSGGNDGTASVTVTSGAGPFTYSWSAFPNVNSSNISGLAPGTQSVTVSNAAGCSTTQSFTVGSSDNSGIETYGSLSVSVYPNPADNQFTVTATELIRHLRVSDISGKTIRDVPVNASGTSLNVSAWASGTYLLHIQTDSRVMVKKVVKQ